MHSSSSKKKSNPSFFGIWKKFEETVPWHSKNPTKKNNGSNECVWKKAFVHPTTGSIPALAPLLKNVKIIVSSIQIVFNLDFDMKWFEIEKKQQTTVSLKNYNSLLHHQKYVIFWTSWTKKLFVKESRIFPLPQKKPKNCVF